MRAMRKNGAGQRGREVMGGGREGSLRRDLDAVKEKGPVMQVKAFQSQARSLACLRKNKVQNEVSKEGWQEMRHHEKSAR